MLFGVPDVRDAADQRHFAAEVLEWLPSLPGSPPLAAVFSNAGVAVASSVLDADPDDDEAVIEEKVLRVKGEISRMLAKGLAERPGVFS